MHKPLLVAQWRSTQLRTLSVVGSNPQPGSSLDLVGLFWTVFFSSVGSSLYRAQVQYRYMHMLVHSLYIHDLINEPQLPWLQTAIIYHMGLDVKYMYMPLFTLKCLP